MKLASISAPQWASRLQKGDYHMVIAPWLVEVPDYARYYNHAVIEGYVILDNGMWEGYDLAPEELVRMAAIARANEVVLPDVLGDGGETLKKAWAALHILQQDPDITGVMFVPQGQTLEAWLRCLKAWKTQWEKSSYFLRFDLCWGLMYAGEWSRGEAIPLALAAGGYPVHLLGTSSVQALVEEELPRSMGVRGLDTSLAFALACNRQLLTPEAVKVPLGAPGKYPVLGRWTLTRARLNILILRHWCAMGKASGEIPIELIRQAGDNNRRAYESPQQALRDARVPQGRYALRSAEGRVVAVRPLKPRGDLVTGETIVEVGYA